MDLLTFKSKWNNRTDEQTRKSRIRFAVALFYFSMGLCFASWASRIPDIKTTLQLSDAAFGTVLFALPMGQLLMMPFSGRLVTRFGSPAILKFALPFYTLCLISLGLAQSGFQLAAVLFLFGVFGNMCNISINTQGVAAERLYQRPIMSSFHGGWSLAGFTGALVGLVMMNFHATPFYHFIIIGVVVWILIIFNKKYLIEAAGQSASPNQTAGLFNKPDRILFLLGVIGFCSMASEGAMFDWSGVYFKDVVKAPASLVVLGYTSFMIMMASGRFVADKLIARYGRRLLLQISGVVISSGLFISVLFPYIIPSTIAFMMVGLGVSSIVPTVYSTAGKHPSVSPGIALATVSSVSFLGFLMGPPIIGYIAEVAGLRYSFAFIGLFGFGISVLVTRMKGII